MSSGAVSASTQRRSVVAAGFGQNIILTTVTTFILVYLLQYAHISVAGMAVVTGILTAAKIFDAICDPIMGSIVDRTSTRWGKMRPYILFSAFPVAALTMAMFAIPEMDETAKLIFFGVAYFLWGLAYTACDVPYWGLIGSAFPEPTQRNHVISLVRAFGALSLGLATLGMPWFARWLSFGPETTGAGWSRAVGISSFFGMGLFLLAFFNTREKARPAAENPPSFRLLYGTLAKNTPLLLALAGATLGFGRNIVQAGGAVFVVIAYGDEGKFTLVGAAIIVGMILASLLTPLLLRRYSAKALNIGNSAISVVLFVGLYFVGFSAFAVLLVFIFGIGLMMGIFSVVQTTMIADAVDDVERRTGIRNDGISFSTLTFVGKITTALAIMVFGIFVVAAGYQDGVTVTPHMQQLVFAAITIVPAISCLASIVPYWFYRLDQGVSTQPVAGSEL